MELDYNQFKFIKNNEKTKVQRLSDIVRYNSRSKITQENVAEHSFYVSIEALKICNTLQLDNETKLKVIEQAIVHDVPEGLVFDAPYDIKHGYPELPDLLQKIEQTELSIHMPELTNTYNDYVDAENNKELSYYIVKLADTISVLQYSFKELELGNETKDMKDIYKDASERVCKYAEIISDMTGKNLYEL